MRRSEAHSKRHAVVPRSGPGGRRIGERAVRLEVGGVERVFEPEVLVVIGYAGRDRAAVEAHIEELAEIGIPRPASIPLYMVFPPWLINQTPTVTVSGPETSGEAELVVVVDGDETFVTLGSDHTDRVLEAVDIVASKGICPKPVATAGWDASAVENRWGRPQPAQLHRRGRALPGRLGGGQPAPLTACGRHPMGGTATPVLRRLHRHGPGNWRDPPERQLPGRTGRPGPTHRRTPLSDSRRPALERPMTHRSAYFAAGPPV